MSQVVTRKSAVSEEKEKRTDSPVKDMKKKMAANAEKEKEKQPSEKTDKQTEKSEKSKQADKPTDNTKQNEKVDNKNESKNEKIEKPKATEKAAETKDKASTSDKPADKKVDKNGVDAKKTDNKDKKETEKKDNKDKKEAQEKKEDKVEKNGKADAKKIAEKPKQNGSKHNGEANGVEESDDDVLEIADDEFPELAYDEGSDAESPSPDNAQSRSFTRRSQVKPTRTPETPQPASEKPAESAGSDDSKESKVLKLNEAPSARKLRSADSPKPQDSKKDKENEEKEKDNDMIEIDDDEPRKTDTNYSKSRVKVSPYRRSLRLADQTASSTMANYTGNNTTMEMELTESSFAEDSLNDSSYLQGLRSIRGRRSYKPLKEITVTHTKRTVKTTPNVAATLGEAGSRPTAPVVGRKRKPEGEQPVELATEAGEVLYASMSKRMRLLNRIVQPFRRTPLAAPLPARRNADIVGINTDLPLTAPVAAPNFDPETLKGQHVAPAAAPSAAPSPALVLTPPTPTATPDERDGKRCIVM